MLSSHRKFSFKIKYIALAIIFSTLMTVPVTRVFADTYDEQIQKLQAEADGYQAEAGRLRAEGDTLQNAVNALTAQKMAIQAELDVTQLKLDQLKFEIEENQKKLERQQQVLGATISDLSAESATSPIELLAGSASIGDFLDRQEYRSAVQNEIENGIRTVKNLKATLAEQKIEVEAVLADQTTQRNDLAAKEAEQTALVAATRGQEAAYQNMVNSRNAEIEKLRAAQVAANARFIGEAGTGPACGGGYPGKWCNIPMDTVVDNWGMYNRQCVSYTAFRVAASNRNMPYWGGIGNAWQWGFDGWAYSNGTKAPGPGNGASWHTANYKRANIPADTYPRPGDVAISNTGSYGHAMYVESVNANGTINISQYNANWQGTYSTNTIDPSGLIFIHF